MKIFIIAGENSGDAIGAKLMSSLRSLYSKEINFSGVGGEQMEALGFKSLYPMNQLSVMGFSEVLPHIPKFIKLINLTVEEIKKQKPDVLVTIDAPDFCFRVAKKLKNSGVKLVHIVAPTVWHIGQKELKRLQRYTTTYLCCFRSSRHILKNMGLKQIS